MYETRDARWSVEPESNVSGSSPHNHHQAAKKLSHHALMVTVATADLDVAVWSIV